MCCCAGCSGARSAGRWQASASTGSACAPWALARTATNSRHSRWRARWGAWPGRPWAAQTGHVTPEMMGFHMSAHALMMLILGGMGNFAGAMIGAFAFEYLLHLFQDLSNKHWQSLMGGFIVLVVLAAPRGLLGLLGLLGQRSAGPQQSQGPGHG